MAIYCLSVKDTASYLLQKFFPGITLPFQFQLHPLQLRHTDILADKNLHFQYILMHQKLKIPHSFQAYCPGRRLLSIDEKAASVKAKNVKRSKLFWEIFATLADRAPSIRPFVQPRPHAYRCCFPAQSLAP